MRLAKQHIDIGLFTNDITAQRRFWSDTVGLRLDHELELAPGVIQHRYDAHDSVIKVNHFPDPFPPQPRSGYTGLTIARAEHPEWVGGHRRPATGILHHSPVRRVDRGARVGTSVASTTGPRGIPTAGVRRLRSGRQASLSGKGHATLGAESGRSEHACPSGRPVLASGASALHGGAGTV